MANKWRQTSMSVRWRIKLIEVNTEGINCIRAIGANKSWENSFVRVRTLATKRLNARHREIDRRAFFVSRQEITRLCEFFKTGSYDSLRSLFEERFPECECNHQGCA